MVFKYRLKGHQMIEESLHAIQQRMADAMARVGRVDTALLVAVTKNHPVSAGVSV